jgi:hypothetical protein
VLHIKHHVIQAFVVSDQLSARDVPALFAFPPEPPSRPKVGAIMSVRRTETRSIAQPGPKPALPAALSRAGDALITSRRKQYRRRIQAIPNSKCGGDVVVPFRRHVVRGSHLIDLDTPSSVMELISRESQLCPSRRFVCAPAGTVTCAPTATIIPSRIKTVPLFIGATTHGINLAVRDRDRLRKSVVRAASENDGDN